MRLHLSNLRLLSYRRLAFLFFIGIVPLSVCSAQKMNGRRLMMFGQSTGPAVDTVYLDVDQDLGVQLLPFDDMVKIAVTNSPLVKYQNEIANSLNSGYAISKTQILQNVGGYAGYSTGNQVIISSGTDRSGSVGNNIGQIANGYRVGVDLRVSLYDLFGRKHQIKQAYSNYRAAVLQKETIEMQLKRDMIGVYQDMITAQQILKVRLSEEQAALTALRVAESEIQKGKIASEIFAEATSRYAQAKTASEEVKGAFIKNVHYFEILVGLPIQRLKRY